MEGQVSKKEAREIENIMLQHFKRETGSDVEAQMLLERFANMLQDPGIKLIHLGDTVFMMILAAPRVAEIHMMTIENNPMNISKQFVQLANFLKNIGVLRAYAYTDDPRFMSIARRTGLPFQSQEVPGKNGETYTLYSMEFA